MHPDLERLLELQAKDLELLGTDLRLKAVGEEIAGLDAALESARAEVEAARGRVAEGVKKRTDLETVIETQRTQQERRRSCWVRWVSMTVSRSVRFLTPSATRPRAASTSARALSSAASRPAISSPTALSRRSVPSSSRSFAWSSSKRSRSGCISPQGLRG